MKNSNQKELKQLRWIYADAKQRCNNPNHPRYYLYGGRGIEFKFKSFAEWYQHIGPRPLGYEQDRINNNGHYEPGNIRWTTQSNQQLNKRLYKSNTSGIRGVTFVTTINKWVVRVNNQSNGKRDYLYVGNDYTEACRARLNWETNKGKVEIRNRRGKSFKRIESDMGL